MKNSTSSKTDGMLIRVPDNYDVLWIRFISNETYSDFRLWG